MKRTILATIGAGAVLLTAACGSGNSGSSADAATARGGQELSWETIYEEHGELNEECADLGDGATNQCLRLRRIEVDTLATTIMDAPKGRHRSTISNSIRDYTEKDDEYGDNFCDMQGADISCEMAPFLMDLNAQRLNLELQNAAGVGPLS